MRKLSFIFALLVATRFLLADIVTLQDGTKIEGDVKKSDRGWTITTSDGKRIELAADKIKSIQLGNDSGKAGSPDRATSDLSSLRRSAENLTDPAAAVERFKRFIEANPDTPLAEDAKIDLAIWQDRVDRGLVKLGNNWISSEARTQFANQALALADQARGLAEHGSWRDAEPIIAEALENDPQCAPALYLRGVLQFEQKRVPAARKSFEAVNRIIKAHGPTLNNLAVILSRQNAVMPSLAHYDQAITAAPVTKNILDNVAVALANVSENQKKNRVAGQLSRKFIEQDTQLQKELAAHGWYRWGCGWIDEESMQKIRDQGKVIDDQVRAVREAIRGEREQLRQVEEQLAHVKARIHRIFMNTPVPFKGGWIRMPFPPVYFELQEEEERLEYQRADIAPNVERADAQIRRLLAGMPQPKFAGTQKLIGVEGMPVITQEPNSLPMPVPTLAPTTAPSKD